MSGVDAPTLTALGRFGYGLGSLGHGLYDIFDPHGRLVEVDLDLAKLRAWVKKRAGAVDGDPVGDARCSACGAPCSACCSSRGWTP